MTDDATGVRESPSLGRRLLRILGPIVFILIIAGGAFWVTELTHSCRLCPSWPPPMA